MGTVLCRLSIGLASALAFADASGAASEAKSDWPAYLGDKGRSLYSPLRQINRSNVAQLKVAWTYDTGDKGDWVTIPGPLKPTKPPLASCPGAVNRWMKSVGLFMCPPRRPSLISTAAIVTAQTSSRTALGVRQNSSQTAACLGFSCRVPRSLDTS